MKQSIISQKWIFAFAMLVLVTIISVQCTKVGTNASQVSRNLVSTPDSAIFAPFYDSTKAKYGDAIADVNDIIVAKSVYSIVKSNCVSASCHGGKVSPSFNNYSDIKSLVIPGNPQASKLFQMVTTSDLKTAMPPITFGVDLSTTEKTIIYNWIANGAKEYPDLNDFRPAAIATLTSGCTSGNCHNQATATGGWAKSGYLAPLSPTDTVSFIYTNPTTGAQTFYTQLNEPKLSQVWQAYKDSVRKFYTDTIAYASYRPWKYFSTRGPLNKYDDIMMDVWYPKSVRSAANVFSVGGVKVNCKGDPLTSTSTLLSRCDSSIVLRQQRAYPPSIPAWATNNQGGMAYSDGGLRPSEVALIKAWYFADPNIPDMWKFGADGTGIFKYRKSGNVITKK